MTVAPCVAVNGWLNCTLSVRVGVWRLGVMGIAFTTRLYNGLAPGPVFHASPGDRVRVLVRNELGQPGDPSNCDHPMAKYGAPNTTNLHMHGIYDSPAQDNTFVCVGPRTTRLYEYTLDKRSGSQLLWYHSHMTGSSGMQLYGGMAGAVDVVDKEQEERFGLASAFAATHIVLIGLLNFDPKSLDYIGKFMSDGGHSTLPLNLQNPLNFSGILVTNNGRASPEQLSIATDDLVQLKIVNAASGGFNLAMLGFISEASRKACAMRVLAYDGVYLHEPRELPSVLLPAGGRAIVAVACQVPGLYSFGTVPASGSYGTFGQALPAGAAVVELLVAQPEDAKAGDSVGTSAPPALMARLPTKLPGPPAFYPDMRGRVVTGRNTVRLSADAGENIINGWPYNGSVTYRMPAGSVQEWEIVGGEATGLLKQHPYHQHMTHFQLTRVSLPDTDGHFVVGDYRDTVPLYRTLNFTMRFLAPPFLGRMMVHCHILKHEDLGMMTLAEVTGLV